jgi:phosphoglycolate phosphatase
VPDLRNPVIFDLDGTVWDSAPGIIGCLEATLVEMGLPVPGSAHLHELLGPPLLGVLAGLDVPDDRLDEGRVIYRRHYREHGEFECVVYDGIPDLLDRLRSAGHLLATATSKGVEVAVRMLDHFGLADRFDVVRAASMTKTVHSKVDIIGEAMAGLESIGGRATSATMVGDRSFDIEGGKHFGLVTVGVTWGYATDGELAEVGPDHIVDDVDQLEVVLTREPTR